MLPLVSVKIVVYENVKSGKFGGPAVHTLIRGFSPWQRLACEQGHCHGEIKIYLADVAILLRFLPPICQVMMRSMLLKWFSLNDDSRLK